MTSIPTFPAAIESRHPHSPAFPVDTDYLTAFGRFSAHRA